MSDFATLTIDLKKYKTVGHIAEHFILIGMDKDYAEEAAKYVYNYAKQNGGMIELQENMGTTLRRNTKRCK